MFRYTKTGFSMIAFGWMISLAILVCVGLYHIATLAMSYLSELLAGFNMIH